MQSWNQWQLPAAPTVTAPMPQPPIGYAAPGADPMAVMQSFMQYYNQPAPNGYTTEQWAAAQQQNWAQWQTWQQQYQQWQAQYGEKYQETMKQMQGLPNLGQLPATTTLAPSAQPPPLPKEDTSTKPPLPPEGSSAYGFSSGIPPPPHQNNLPLFPSNKSSNPPLPTGQPPLPPDSSRNNASIDNPSSGKRTANSIVESVSAKKLKVDDEELTEAEKTFDAQFKQWEEQFNKWKQQNANHPDKTQYKQYEAKWTSWREKLIERREQMRRKREQQKQAAAKAEAEKDKSMVGDDKILNLLTSTENQGLINNLLGIGKTLGLTGKNETACQGETPRASSSQPHAASVQPLTLPSNINPAAWAAQQWAAQYNAAGTNMMNYASNFQQPPGLAQIGTNPLPTGTMSMPNFNQPPNFCQPPTNFNQPPPGLMGTTQNLSNMPPNMSSGGPNFSQPPPGFGSSNQRQQQGDSTSGNRSGNSQDPTASASRPDGDQRQSSISGAPFNDSVSATNDRFNFGANQFSGPPPNNFAGMNPTGGNGANKDFSTGNQMGGGTGNNRQDNRGRDFSPAGRSGNEFRSGDIFGSAFEKDQSDNRFSRNGENHEGFGDNRIASDRDTFNPDRFGTSSDRFGMRNDRFGSNNDRFASSHDKFNSDNDQFRSRNDQFGGMSGDRFGTCADRPAMGSLGSLNDKFNRPAPDRFDSRDSSRDSGSTNFRNFGRGNQFNAAADMPPELQKLMEKRRAAMDVFKPSNFSSLLDSAKSSSTSTSLSESFRKLTGDSPFLTRSSLGFGKDTNVGPRGPMFGSSGSDIGNFESSRDNRAANNNPGSKFRAPGGDFAPRGPGDYRPRVNEFGPRDMGDFNSRDSRDFGPAAKEFVPQESDGPDGRPRNSDNFEHRTGNRFGQRGDREFDGNGQDRQQITGEDSMREGAPAKSMDKRKDESEAKENPLQSDSMRSDDDANKKNVPPLQVPSWIETDFANGDFNETLGNKSVEKAANDPLKEPSNEDCQPLPNIESSPRVVGEESKDRAIASDKKADDLPFMGENDPKPEDLNMEPPPELPNLGPTMKDGDPKWEPNEKVNTNEAPDRQHCDDGARRNNFDTPFGPPDMQSRDSTSFGPRNVDGAGPAESMRPPRGPFGSHCFGDGSRGPELGSFEPRGPFGPRGPGDDFRARGPGDFGPFGPRGPSDFRPRNPNDRSFGPRGMSPFAPCGPMDRPFGPSGANEPPFAGNNHPSFGSNTFGPRGKSDNPGAGIPSLMSFKFDKPNNSAADMAANTINDSDMNRWGDLPPAFRKPDEEPREERSMPDRGGAVPGPNIGRGPDWRESFGRNQFGDSDQRSGPPKFPEASAMRPGNPMAMDRDRGLPGPPMNQGKGPLPFVPDGPMQNRDMNLKPGDPMAGSGPYFDETSRGPLHENARPGGSNFTSRRPNEGRRMEGPKEFCVEKQFNYNHGTGIPDEMTKEHLSGNVIDYGHAPRVIVHDYVTPSQSFDYDHGRLKPVVPDHEIYCKRDFRNWIENEQNLREYDDRMRVYESDVRALKRSFDQRNPHTDVRPQFRERDRMQDDRRSFEHERRLPVNRNDRSRRDREADDYREREHKGLQRDNRERGRNERDREWERASNKQREDRSQQRRSRSKDRTRERPEKIRKETNKENKKDDQRSKGNVADSESSAKKPDESTFPDNSNKPEDDDDEPVVLEQVAEVPQNVEATQAMDPPATMELPKTPNFTMVDDLLCPPGRQNRPPKIVVILRGPPGSGKSFVAKLIKDKEVEQGGSAPRILSLDDYFLTEKEIETEDNNGKKTMTKEMVYEYEEAMEPSYITSLVKAFKKNITDGFFNFIILDSINEKISDYEEMWSFAKTKGFRVYVCEMEMDVQICLKRNIHNRTEDEINRIVDYFEPTPGHHQKLDVTSMLQEESIEEVHMEDTQDVQPETTPANDDSQDSQEDPQASAGVSKWEKMEAEDKLDRLDGLAKRKNEGKPQTMEDFLQVVDDYNVEDSSGKRRVRWADLEERKEQEKMRAVGFVVGQTNWDRMMDPTNGSSALTRTKYI